MYQKSWRILEGFGTNNGDAHVHLLVSKEEELDTDVEICVSLDCPPYEIAEFHLARGMREETAYSRPQITRFWCSLVAFSERTHMKSTEVLETELSTADLQGSFRCETVDSNSKENKQRY